jgi:hypothetical protein
LLGRAVDRAILIDAIGLELTAKLGCYGITSATELVDTPNLDALIVHTPPVDDVTMLHGAAALTRARLQNDSRVKSVRGWLADSIRP